jgi:hypothetical protein
MEYFDFFWSVKIVRPLKEFIVVIALETVMQCLLTFLFRVVVYGWNNLFLYISPTNEYVYQKVIGDTLFVLFSRLFFLELLLKIVPAVLPGDRFVLKAVLHILLVLLFGVTVSLVFGVNYLDPALAVDPRYGMVFHLVVAVLIVHCFRLVCGFWRRALDGKRF